MLQSIRVLLQLYYFHCESKSKRAFYETSSPFNLVIYYNGQAKHIHRNKSTVSDISRAHRIRKNNSPTILKPKFHVCSTRPSR